MASTFSLLLAKLDASVQTFQAQLEGLRAGLEVNEGQVRQALKEANSHAMALRDLLRAELPDAQWKDRQDLDRLIHELEVAAKARLNQQRRTRLLELANELDAGRARHRFESRAAALNELRLEAVNELRTEAALPEQTKELPGPSVDQWLSWAYNLDDKKDAMALEGLRRDFSALERFTCEMEESHWVPGQRKQENPSSPP